MKIYQPTISSSAYIAGLTTASQANVLTYNDTTGEIFYTASSAIGGGGSGAGFPYVGNAVITGSLLISGSGLTVTGSIDISGSLNATASWATTAVTASYAQTLTIQGTLTDYASIASTSPGPNNLFTRNTGSFTSAFGKYTLYNGVNSRAGEFVTSWNSTTTSYYDNSTVDIGSTSAVTFASSIVSGQVQINTGVSTPSGWTIKMLITYI